MFSFIKIYIYFSYRELLCCIIACVLLQTWNSLMHSDGVANQVNNLIRSAGFLEALLPL